MNIGEPLRIVEVEPLWDPLPDAPTVPVEEPMPQPEPVGSPP